MIRPFDRSIDFKPALNWRVLGLLNLYRVLAPLVLLALYPLGGARGFSIVYPQLFFGSTLAYLCFGLGSVSVVRRRLASAYVQTILQEPPGGSPRCCSWCLLHALRLESPAASGYCCCFPSAVSPSCCRLAAQHSSSGSGNRRP